MLLESLMLGLQNVSNEFQTKTESQYDLKLHTNIKKLFIGNVCKWFKLSLISMYGNNFVKFSPVANVVEEATSSTIHIR